MGNHRAERGDRRRTSAAPAAARRSTSASAGKRRAAAPARTPLTSIIPTVPQAFPSVPLVAGVTVLAVAAGGALAFADSDVAIADERTALVAGKISEPVATPEATEEPRSRGTVVSRSAVRTPVTDTAAPELLQRVEAQVSEREDALAADNVSAARRAATIEENQWVMPLSGYRISAQFGQASYLWSTVHTGLDLSAPTGTPVVAVANGTITEVGYDGSYGNKIVLTLEDGTETWYCHLSAFDVSVGDTVTGGEVIGFVGSTGNSTGSHLHLEVRPGAGDPVNPYDALVEHGVTP